MATAARRPARREPANNQLLRPMAIGRIWFSHQLCRLPDYAASPEPRTQQAAESLFRWFELSALSKVLKEGEQGVRRSVTRRHDTARIGVRECAFLEPHVGVQVDLGCLR